MPITRIIENIEQVKDHLPVPVSVRIESINPYLDDALQKYMLPYLGLDLIDRLEAHIEENEPGEEGKACEKLLDYIRKPLARFSVLLGTDQLDLKLSDSGFVVQSNTNTSPASPERVAKFKASLESSAWDGIEQLLRYLEKHIEDFEEWEKADAHPANWKTIIRSAAEFQKHVNIDYSVLKFFKMRNAIENAELLYLQPKVSVDYMDELREEVEDDVVSEDNKKTLPLIRKALANFVMIDEDPSKKQQYENLANHYLNAALKIMDGDPTKYETYANSDAYDADRTTYSSYENTEDSTIFVFGG